MALIIGLDLAGGGRVELEVAPPALATSCYFVSALEARAEAVWPSICSLLAASGRPIVNYSFALHQRGYKERDVARDALEGLVWRDGYAFGLFRVFNTLPIGLDEAGRETFIFVRDPRSLVFEAFAQTVLPSTAELQSSHGVQRVLKSCRAVIDFVRARQHVTLLRIEEAASDPDHFVARMVQALHLKPEPDLVRRTAGSIDPGRIWSRPGFAERFGAAELTVLEDVLGEELAILGYPSLQPPSVGFQRNWQEFLTRSAPPSLLLPSRAAVPSNAPTSPATPVPAVPAAQLRAPGSNVEYDPELGWRLRANSRQSIVMLGRNVVMEVDASGCRPVLGQRALGEKTLAVYGCSFTFGFGLPYEETFCSLLQSHFPRWRVENHGVGAYGTAQNLVQLRRNARWDSPEFVTFCWIPSHLLRNVADISFRRETVARNRQSGGTRQKYLRAALGPAGELEFRFVAHPRRDLDGIDLDDFRHDAYYLDLVAAAIFRRANEIVVGASGHFFVTMLMPRMSPTLHRLLAEAGIPVVEAPVVGNEYTLLPDDRHPNGLANLIYAVKIRDYLEARTSA